MSGKAIEALEFLLNDVETARKQWEDGKQMESFTQRNSVTVKELDDKFDPQEDENAWCSEYNGEALSELLRLYRKRLAFLKGSRKEFHEDYDDDVSDVDFMRLLEVPFTDSEYVLKFSKKDLQDVQPEKE